MFCKSISKKETEEEKLQMFLQIKYCFRFCKKGLGGILLMTMIHKVKAKLTNVELKWHFEETIFVWKLLEEKKLAHL